MKKIITITAVLFTAAFISSSAFAWWGGGMMGNHHDGRYTTNNTGDRQAFYDATQDLRASLAADQAELNAVLAKDNPDSAKIKDLSLKIVKEKDQLREQAEKFQTATADDDDFCPGYGHGGYGHGGYGHMMGWN